MANGRSSCTVGAYRTAEVYSNASGGASSVTFYGTSTVKDNCFDVSINISDTSITAETETTVFTASGTNSVCGCFTYGGFHQVENCADGTFAGVGCYSYGRGTPANYNGQYLYLRCNGTLVKSVAETDSNYETACPSWHMGSPLPWLGSLKAQNTTDLIPVHTSVMVNTLRLQCFTCFGGDVEIERAKEWYAASGYGKAAYCQCTNVPDRDGCNGLSSCYAFRPCYGVVGAKYEGRCHTCCNMWQHVTTDYWSKHRLYMWLSTSQGCANCPAEGYACVSCQSATASALQTQNGCMDNVIEQGQWNHCCSQYCRHICASNLGTNCYMKCVCNCHPDAGATGSDHRARQQKFVALGCNSGFFSNPPSGIGQWRARDGNSGHYLNQFICTCYAGQCSCARFCWQGDGTTPMKWITYNCIDGKNYFLWYHANTADWNGIYSQDQTQIDSLILHSCGCSCSFTCYGAGDAYPTGFATKVADVPACWTQSTADNSFFVNAHQIGPTCFITFYTQYNADCHCFIPQRYYSADLITWSCSPNSAASFPVSDSTVFSGTSTTLKKVVSNYGTLCDKGQIEKCTCGIQLERTGIVTSNGDKIYVKNSSATPISVNVWGYENS